MLKKYKFKYYDKNVWRKLFLLKNNRILKPSECYILSRNSHIPKSFINYNFYIYNGNKWIRRRVNKWNIGYKFGCFTWNRKLALYKAKQLKKKKSK